MISIAFHGMLELDKYGGQLMQTQRDSSTTPDLEFRSVTRSFTDGQNHQSGVFDISVEVPKGKIIALIGPSGSGKSTLLSLCNLLASPDAGQVLVFGKEVREWNPVELRRTVGLVFQTPTVFPGTVEENLAVPAKLHHLPVPPAQEWLRRVGLDAELVHQKASDLSGGQKQRLALARTLANQPEVLLLDEVTSALDPASAKEVEELILEIHKSEQKTILWVTHNLEQAKRTSDLTWLLVNGKLVEAGLTRGFFQSPQTDLGRKFLAGELSGRREQ